MIKYIVYGNTDYLDVLQIQTDYINAYGDVTLFINKNDLELSDLYSNYKKVIYYDGNDTYAKRLQTCLEQIDDDFILFIHDIDVLLSVDDKILNILYEIMVINNFDRIDLKHSPNNTSDFIIETNGVSLIKENSPTEYIYNVNPSIWKRKALLEIVTQFPYKTYRTIEDLDVQYFCAKFNIFKLYSENKLSCGYFNCLPFFKFLHISHSGKLLPLNNDFVTTFGQSYEDISDDYVKIVDKYDLKSSNKWIK